MRHTEALDTDLTVLEIHERNRCCCRCQISLNNTQAGFPTTFPACKRSLPCTKASLSFLSARHTNDTSACKQSINFLEIPSSRVNTLLSVENGFLLSHKRSSYRTSSAVSTSERPRGAHTSPRRVYLSTWPFVPRSHRPNHPRQKRAAHTLPRRGQAHQLLRPVVLFRPSSSHPLQDRAALSVSPPTPFLRSTIRNSSCSGVGGVGTPCSLVKHYGYNSLSRVSSARPPSGASRKDDDCFSRGHAAVEPPPPFPPPLPVGLLWPWPGWALLLLPVLPQRFMDPGLGTKCGNDGRRWCIVWTHGCCRAWAAVSLSVRAPPVHEYGRRGMNGCKITGRGVCVGGRVVVRGGAGYNR